MGNTTSSSEGPYANVELPAQEQPLVAIDQRFVKPEEITTLQFKESSSDSKKLAFKDVKSRQVLFHTGPHTELKEILDADKKPIVQIAKKKNIKCIYYAFRPNADKDEEDAELLQVYVKQGLTMKKGYLDTQMRADFMDLTTGERCKIEIEGEWRSRNAVLWLQRSHDSSRTPVGKIHRPSSAMHRAAFNLDIAPNVDTALVLLICAIVDEDLKILRRYENRHGVVVHKTVEYCK